MILSAVIPRWWNVTPSQLHWVALHMHYGEFLLEEATLDPEVRHQVLETLRSQAAPVRVQQLSVLLDAGDVKAALEKVTPSELFVLAAQFGANSKTPSSPWLAEIRRLAAASPRQVNYPAISAAFGNAQAHSRQFLSSGAPAPAHVPDPDGLFQPHPGRKLGV